MHALHALQMYDLCRKRKKKTTNVFATQSTSFLVPSLPAAPIKKQPHSLPYAEILKLLLILRLCILQLSSHKPDPFPEVVVWWSILSLLLGWKGRYCRWERATEDEEGARRERGWAHPPTLSHLSVFVPTTLRLESISFPLGFPHFLCLLPQTVHPPSLPPTKVTTQQTLINVIFFFLKVALEKGNLTAVRQNRELNASRPLSTKAQLQEQNEAECKAARGSWWFPAASAQGFVCCAEPSSAWVLWSRLSLPLFVSPAFCLLPLVSWLVTKGPWEPPLLWGWEPSLLCKQWAAD